MFSILKPADYDPAAYCEWDRLRLSPSTDSTEPDGEPWERLCFALPDTLPTGPAKLTDEDIEALEKSSEFLEAWDMPTDCGFAAMMSDGPRGSKTVTYY